MLFLPVARFAIMAAPQPKEPSHGQRTATQQQGKEKTETAEEAVHPHGPRPTPREEIVAQARPAESTPGGNVLGFGPALARTGVAKFGVAAVGVHQRRARALLEGNDFTDQDQVVAAR